MKKGLLSILASTLLVVGCQNYDDQFSNLESQISALATTVAGLAQVQSDLSSLAGTVASLSSTVNGLGSTIDTAVANGLADIQADVDAITTAVADVASSEEVDALSTAVAAAGADLDELLANSSVFSGSVTINSVATLAAFKAMGSTLAIINGSVDITAKADMSQPDIQAVVDEMLTITGDFTYTSQAAEIAETKFTNLSGVQSITVTQAGGYSFPALVSASNITLGTTFSSKVGIIDFGELTSVVKFSSTADHQVHFSKATNFHITKLTRYGASLSVLLDEGSTFLMDALTDTNAAGVQSALELTIEGPKAMNISTLDGKGGSISMKDVVTATVTDYDGAITLLAGVETFSSNNVVAITHSGAADIVSFTAKGVLDPNATAAAPDKSGPVIDFSSKADLETVVLTGDFESIKLNGNNNMVSATIGAKSSNGIIDITDNGDLVTLDTTGSSATGFTLHNNDNLVTAALQTVMIAGTATGALLNGSVIVTNNDDMTTLEIWSSSLNTLTITSNSDLNKITGEKIIAKGVTAGGTVTISGNDLEASVAQTLTAATATAASTGVFTTASNVGSLAAYLKLIAADTAATANVYFDTVQSSTSSASVETQATTTGQVADNIILVTAPGSGGVTTGNNAAVYATKAWLLDVSNLTGRVTMTLDSQPLLYQNGVYVAGIDPSNGSTASAQAITLSELMRTESESRATLLGATLKVYKGGNATMPNVLFSSRISSTSNKENYTNAQALALYGASAASGVDVSLTTWDKVTFTLGGLSVVATITGSTYHLTNTAASTNIAAQIEALWDAKYGLAAGTSSTMSVWGGLGNSTVMQLDGIALKSSTAGSRGYLTQNDISVSFAPGTAAQISAASAGAATNSFLDWMIGVDGTTDNVPVSTDLIVTVQGSAGQDLSTLVVTDGETSSAGRVTLTSASYTYANAGAGTATSTTLNVYPLDARNDVINVEGANEGTTTATVARVNTNRSQWTFGG